ncbi:hypothetical protein [uncultured Roseobacter sp.]|uniref:hypothetical protein n=1 Tax=uncultured Roseobacter sp. TaxID=114847 RepID=UPI002630ED04|nr:hypothetical protein [uncultured Roseobacter sp.]
MGHAKLSEYKFLKVPRGFAIGISSNSLATATGISEKSIRAIYAALRSKVMEAAKSGKPVFGISSRYLFENGKPTEKGKAFLDAVSKSGMFEAYLKIHAPRLRNKGERDLLVFDLGMRIFTGLVVAEEDFLALSPGLRRSMEQLIILQIWIDANADTPGFAEEHRETIERHRALKRMAEIVREQHQIIALRQSAKHRYAGEQYYTDLRKYLLKNPI